MSTYKTLNIARPDGLFFIADTHFWHKRAAEMRGFESVEAMNEALINRWNEVVAFNDTVVIVGDFSFAGSTRTLEILDELKGKMHLVRGNHDKAMNSRVLDYFESVNDILNVKVQDGETQRIVCCHFPMLSWDMSHYGAWHLHGHSHGSCVYPWPDAKILDVGVDCHDLPLSYKAIKAIMIDRKTRSSDYHKEVA